jgi:integrase
LVAILSGGENLQFRPREIRLAANHAFAAMRGFFGWAARHDYVTTSPCDRLQSPAIHIERDRVLTDAELAKVFLQARVTPYPFGYIVQLLILTGQRRGEIAALRWEWIDHDEKTITLPASLTKNKREHFVPFGEMAAAVLATIPRQNEFVFPALRDRKKGEPATIFAGWGKPKAAFDKAIQGKLQKSPVGHWTLHDLRRTASTMWAKIGVPQNINDRLLNHVSGGTLSPVAAIYNRYQFQDEMREAVEKYEGHLLKLLVS